MRLKVLLPSEVLLDATVTKVIAEAENGAFCLLPRHIDFIAALVPGLLSFETENGREEFLAIDEGILVKCGAQVLVSTRQAVRGPELGSLRQAIDEQFRAVDEQERKARAAAARLEADLVRRFLELEPHGR
jgi:F-type H+-transporting ATPase subunit epsilon